MTTIACGIVSGERTRLRSPYIARMLAEEEGGEKIHARERIAEFICSHLTVSPNPHRFFSLPGAHWLWERDMLGRCRDAECTAVERLGPILDAGLTFMPGTRRYRITEENESGSIHGITSEEATIFHADMSAFLSFWGGRGQKAEKRRFRSLYLNWSGIWVDFQASACSEIAWCLPRLHVGADMHRPVVPVVVTLMKAREPTIHGNGIALCGSRVDWVCRYLASANHGTFGFLESFEYQSGAGTPMLTVMGVFRP